MIARMGPQFRLDDVLNLYSDDSAAKAILDWIAGRTREARITKVDTVEGLRSETGEPVRRQDAVRVLKSLAVAGCGVFKNGRRKSPSRLIWSVSARAVARAARGESVSEAQIAGSDVDRDAGNENAALRTSAVLLEEHAFPLRPGVRAVFPLPRDLTVNEAQRLATFILSLPYEAIPAATRAESPAASLLQSGSIGGWRDRTDIHDSSAFARAVRQEAEKRS